MREFEQRNQELLQRKKSRELRKIVADEEQEKVLEKNCTFAPKINQRSSNKSRTINHLHEWKALKESRLNKKRKLLADKEDRARSKSLLSKGSMSILRLKNPSDLKVEDRLLLKARTKLKGLKRPAQKITPAILQSHLVKINSKQNLGTKTGREPKKAASSNANEDEYIPSISKYFNENVGVLSTISMNNLDDAVHSKEPSIIQLFDDKENCQVRKSNSPRSQGIKKKKFKSKAW